MQLERSNIDIESNDNGNIEFEGEVFDTEEYSLHPVSSKSSTVEIEESKPYYLPFTDVTYPGEIDSVFDFKRFE